MNFHSQSIEDALIYLQSSAVGLETSSVESKRKQYGWNVLPERGKIHWFWILLKQFKSLLVAVLLVAAVICWLIGDMVDVYVITGIVLVNAAIGFAQERKSENAIASLKKMLVSKARVIRNGSTHIIMARELVPGDIIILEEGDSIPADARIIEAKNLRCIESSLTGESVPVGKDVETLPENTPLADRKNIVLKSTFVASGFGKAVVCGTGLNTAIGGIAETLGSIKIGKTNFQKKTDKLATQMSALAIVCAIIFFIVGYLFSDLPYNELLLISIAALVAAIPEGMPAILSVVLTIGSNRMAKRNAIIRELNSVETLGAVTTIITDKTGTLTQNTLTVKKMMLVSQTDYEVSGEGWATEGKFFQNEKEIEIKNNIVLNKLMQIAAISNNSDIKFNKEKNTYVLAGDPTEGALLALAKKGNVLLSSKFKGNKIDDLPFNSKLKYRATLFENSIGKELLVVGAPEKIMELSSKMLTTEGEIVKDKNKESEIQAKINEWSGNAMRVIALAYKSNADTLDENKISDLVFVGIVGMIDPPRTDVKNSILQCHKAGIRVIMATGDHINTALAIAHATGIVVENKQNGALALTEQQLLELDDVGFEQAIQKTNVFARLTPQMKLRIAESLQVNGELIAMTGDGVNDAPALKKADVGVAMGIMGTDVARDASDVVLADDNFSTIINAVEEGRIVFTNVRQTSFFLITTNFASISILIILVAMGYPIALTATQILWLNLVTDGVADLALAAEKGHGGELLEKPVNKFENILNWKSLPILLTIALFMTTLSLVTYFYYLPKGIDTARTMVFIVMASTQLFNLYNMRSLKNSVFEIGLFSNKYINISMILSFSILVAIIEIPFFGKLFNFVQVQPLELILLIGISSLVLWSGEVFKLIIRKINRDNMTNTQV
jgi:Ca2+-transporting ATPase